MSYYRGDYYRGDYYRGDPFIGALLGKAVGMAGAAIGRVVGAASRRVSPRTMERIQDIGTGAGLGAGLAGRNRPMELTPIQGVPGAGAGKPARIPMDRLKLIPKGPRRRINPLNPRALRRALRRAEGFEKFAARTINGLYKVVDGRRVRTYKKRSK